MVFINFRKLFWSVLGIGSRIESSNLDGSNRTILVKSKVIWPTDIAVDYSNRRLYWTDMKKQTIESVRLDGSDRRVSWMFTTSALLSTEFLMVMVKLHLDWLLLACCMIAVQQSVRVESLLYDLSYDLLYDFYRYYIFTSRAPIAW